MQRALFLAAPLSLATMACTPETFEAEGIRLYDAAEKCKTVLDATKDATPDAAHVTATIKRCKPIWDANMAHIAKSEGAARGRRHSIRKPRTGSVGLEC